MRSERDKRAPGAADSATPADFLANLGKALRKRENIDTGLADILVQHLLTATPAVDAVANAKDDIVKLAIARAIPPKPEVGGA